MNVQLQPVQTTSCKAFFIETLELMLRYHMPTEYVHLILFSFIYWFSFISTLTFFYPTGQDFSNSTFLFTVNLLIKYYMPATMPVTGIWQWQDNTWLQRTFCLVGLKTNIYCQFCTRPPKKPVNETIYAFRPKAVSNKPLWRNLSSFSI